MNPTHRLDDNIRQKTSTDVDDCKNTSGRKRTEITARDVTVKSESRILRGNCDSFFR